MDASTTKVTNSDCTSWLKVVSVMLIGLGWLVEIVKFNIIIIIKYSKHSDMPKEIAAILLQQVRATVLGSGLRAQGYSQGLFWRFGLGGWS